MENFGLNPRTRGKYPVLEDGVVKYKYYDVEYRDPIYVAVASFITSYARRDIIKSSETIREYSLKKYGVDCYIYSDTDSIHCLLNAEKDENDNYILKNDKELYKMLDIDDYRLGAWKIESTFKRGKYLRQKCYIEEDDEKINTTIAGLPKKLGKYVNFDNFTEGMELLATDTNIDEKDYKLRFKHVRGGVILVPTDFSIKN